MIINVMHSSNNYFIKNSMFQIQFLMNSAYYTIPYIYASLDEAEEDMKYI
jgi:hypothetical protein